MFVKFINLKFKNILSYGSELTQLDFENGLNLISGKNGSGKSSFLDALSFCLYGKPYRQIKIQELINRTNRKKLYTECNFEIKDDSYVIIRTLKPYNVSIKKNGNDLELLSSKKLIQEDINKILSIDYSMFKHIISLAVNYNKAYLSMNISEKRDIIESIFNIKIFGEMMKLCKIENTVLKTQKEILSKTILINEENLKSLRKNLQYQKKIEKTFNVDKQNEINKINEEIKKIQYSLKINETKVELKEKRLNSSSKIEDLDELRKNYKDKTRDLNFLESKNINLKNTLELLEKNNKCPVCFSKITDEHKEIESNKLNSELLKNDEEIKILTIELEKIESKIKLNQKIKEDKINLEDDLKNIHFENVSLKENEKKLNTKIIEVENRKIDFNIEKLEEEMEKKTRSYIENIEIKNNLDKNLNEYELVSKVLSDEGIKSYILKKMIPLLNRKINYYIKKFELPIYIELNEYLDDKIISVERFKEPISYWSFSEGEKKRIDISLLLSFIDITKMVCNWSTNLLIFDELIDGQVDENGLLKIITSVKEIVLEKKLCSYIISHRLSEYDYFEKHLKVIKRSNFSKIIEEK